LLNRAKHAFDAALTAFELVSEIALGLVVRHIPGAQRPGAMPALGTYWPNFLRSIRADVEEAGWHAECLGAGAVRGGTVIAASEAQTQKAMGVARKHFRGTESARGSASSTIFRCRCRVLLNSLIVPVPRWRQSFPACRVVAFGHVGDGNLHYNLSHPDASDNARLIADAKVASEQVHETVIALGGSISAEHGIGQLKREELLRYKSPVEMALMRSIKQALDPRGLMNPGKVL
jgi:FAD/FMN-containing dehydrogenase